MGSLPEMEFARRVFENPILVIYCLAAVCSLAFLAFSLVLSFKIKNENFVKVASSLLVASLCFAANNWFVYATGVFVVATLVTELEFLEKLAAIMLNRAEYWQFRLANASASEVKEKIESEVTRSGPPPLEIAHPDPADNSLRADISRAYNFHRLALSLLGAESGAFKHLPLDTEVALIHRGGRSILDGIIHGKRARYIVEIKLSTDKNALLQAASQVRKYIGKYQRYLREQDRAQTVRGFLVVPDSPEVENSYDGVPALKLDLRDAKFTNVDILKRAFEDWEWSE